MPISSDTQRAIENGCGLTLGCCVHLRLPRGSGDNWPSESVNEDLSVCFGSDMTEREGCTWVWLAAANWSMC